MGEQSVKNIARPVRVYALRPEAVADLPARSVRFEMPRRRFPVFVAIAATAVALLVIAVSAWWLWPASRSSPTPTAPAAVSIAQPLVAPRLSIVVLPFTNLSNDPDQQYFADGITENLTTDLSRIAGMFVISRNSAFTYKGKPVDTKQIGRELGVRYVLEGSVQRSGQQVRVNAQLIDAESDAHLWAERFDGDMSALFALQDEITARIGNTLNLELIAAEAARPSERPDALDYILRGRAATLKPNSPAVFAEEISFFEHALALDPQSAEAQTRLAGALVGRVLDIMTNSATADLQRAEALVDQALVASPRSGIGHLVKGELLRAQNRCEQAIPEYEAALALNRNFLAARHGLALCKLFAGEIEEVIPLEEEVIRRSPRDPVIGWWYFTIGSVHLLQSRNDEAIVWLEKARAAVPAASIVHARLAAAYALKGETERAAAELAEARRLNGDVYSSMARLQAVAVAYFGVPKMRALYEATYFAGLRKAGMPEE
jgi:adenylate cyclase